MAELFANNTIGDSYKEHMTKEHDGSNWGVTGAKYSGSAVAEIIKNGPHIATAMDYGCGKGMLAKAFPDLKWTEYDPGIPGKQEKPTGRYDLVTCTDVMEHVEREYVEEVLRELAEATGKVLFIDIACYPTGRKFWEGPYKGEDMHITIRSPNWWIKMADEHTGLHMASAVKSIKYSKGRHRERVQLTYERV